jgi:drug/metabolite transporter (DMT)-like permease
MNSFVGINILFALASAALWGGGDFSGGMGAKSAGGSMGAAVRIVLMSHLMSFTVLLCVARIFGYPFPHGAVLVWGIGAGVAGGLSLTCFYIALSRGAMGASAAISGLLAAAIPAVVAAWSDGSPGVRKLIGFAVAGVAIWLIAAGPVDADAPTDRSTMVLALVAGVGFGVYFVALKMAGAAGPIWAMASARIGSLSACSLVLLGLTLLRRNSDEAPVRISRRTVAWAFSTAVLDTSGNLLFVAATRAGRLDVASVLASLYPASTILLAAITLGERPTRRQGLGMATAAVAVVLIAL